MPLYDHIILPEQVKVAIDYTPPSGGGQRPKPERDRDQHAQMLQRAFENARALQASGREAMQALALPARNGLYVEFTGAPAFELATSSLESLSNDIRLLNVREIILDNETIQESATVFIPQGKENIFLEKLEQYATEDTRHNKPRNAALIDSIENIRSAQLQSLWTDKAEKFPTDVEDWYEIWIKTPVTGNEDVCVEFINTLDQLQIEYKSTSRLDFPERAIFLIKANRGILDKLLKASDYLAEIRSVSPLNTFFVEQASYEAKEWIDELKNRVDFDQDSNSVVSVIDTGVNNGHPLLQDLLPDANCDTVVTESSADSGAHGTQMCGVVAYGDLYQALETTQAVSVNKQLVSVKIKGRTATDKENWGELTKQAALKSSIIYPHKNICYCMAVTAEESDDGKPTSWSAAVDDISTGEKQLFLISAGNINDINGNDREIINNYPNNNSLRKIQNPAQAWNALTIGAYTNLVAANSEELAGFELVASTGGISPYSRTSGLWKKQSLIKPEVMFEGGNLKKTNDVDFPYTPHHDLSVLTVNSNFAYTGLFDTIYATSCATALAADFAGRLQAKYPHLWSESIRGLMVHSAKWTDEMIRQFPANNKTAIGNRLRMCGYGVPSEKRAFNSTENGFTYIAQEELRPYKKEKSSIKINEMHFYELPWPKDVLQELSDIDVTLKITLSYFIEPAPGEIGWKNKYRYASHGLRFALNKSDEDERAFKLRINRDIELEENEERGQGDSARWLIGSDNRNKGSVHSDEIKMSAIQLVDCNMIAIYPIGGWWKTRTNLQRHNSQARYSLIISLDTPAENVDLYNVVKTKIENILEVPVQVEIQIG
ncbi:MAG: S8 family peptidase [Bacteroidales bacterium]